jgi:tRNA threonylcarbamoyladenosine biosynthesis protein TsaB
MLLALETANDQCSVGLYDTAGLLAYRFDARPREQTRLLLPMIDEVLTELGVSLPELDAIAFSRGPGSFSGVRINAAVAQALAWTHDLSVIPVSTLQALAQAATEQYGLSDVVAVLDARMNEVYAAAYQRDHAGLMQPIGAEQLAAYDQVVLPPNAVLAGSGANLVQSDQVQQRYLDVAANAGHVGRLALAALRAGQTVAAADALPVYLRDDAWKKLDAQRAG